LPEEPKTSTWSTLRFARARGGALEKQVHTSTGELLARAANQLDPSDPTRRWRSTRQRSPSSRSGSPKGLRGQTELSAKVDPLSTALKVQDAKSSLAKVTPIKGGSFEDQIRTLM
jgi:hypothetical protein